MQVCRDTAHRITKEPSELCSKSTYSQRKLFVIREDFCSAAAVQDSARPQLCGEALVSHVKQGEGAAFLFLLPGALLHLPGDSAPERTEAEVTTEVPGAWWGGGVGPCGAGQPCKWASAPLWHFLQEVAAPPAWASAGDPLDPPRVITHGLGTAKMGVVVPAPEWWEVMATAVVTSLT